MKKQKEMNRMLSIEKRIDCDYHIWWPVKINGGDTPLSDCTLSLDVMNPKGERIPLPFELTEDGIEAEFEASIQQYLGEYTLMLTIVLADSKTIVDKYAGITLVPYCVMADPTEAENLVNTTITVPSGNFAVGIKGKSFKYEDFTEEQLSELKRPAEEAAEQARDILGRADEAVRKGEALVEEMGSLKDDLEIAEEGRKLAENERVRSEFSRATAEENREDAENLRIASENTRIIVENARRSSETLRDNAESARSTAESARVASENARISAENRRQSAETTRTDNEDSRIEAEKARVANEQARIEAERERGTKIGDMSQLQTPSKETLVGAINDAYNHGGGGTIPTKVSELENDAEYITPTDIYNDKLFGKGSGRGSIQQIGEKNESVASGDWSFAVCEGKASGKRSFSIGGNYFSLVLSKVGDKTYKTNTKSDYGEQYLYQIGGIISTRENLIDFIAKITSVSRGEDKYYIITTDNDIDAYLPNLALLSCAYGNNSSTFNGFAYGQKSFASYFGITIGQYSVSLGMYCAAVGKASVATTYATIAEGDYSFAEGFGSKAIGAASHAEGQVSESRGLISHAQGDGTIAENRSEHAQGSYNLSHKASTTNGDKGNTHSSIGIGWDKVNRKNAQEVMQNGDFYVLGIGGYDGTNPNTEGVKTIQEVLADLESRLHTVEIEIANWE